MRKFIGLGLGLGLLAALFVGEIAAQTKKKGPELIKELADKNPKVRAAAAQDLGDLADIRINDVKPAIPMLKEMLKDTDPNVRKAVVESLGKIEPDAYTGLLIETAKTDKDPIVLLSVVNALGQMQPPPKAAAPVLIDVYKASPQDVPKTPTVGKNPPPPPPNPNMPPADAPAVRRAVIGAIQRVDVDPKTRVTFYVEALQMEKDLNTLVNLVNTVGQVGPPAKDALPVLLEKQKASMAEAAKAPMSKERRDLDPQGLRRAILQAVTRIQPDAKEQVPLLIEVLKLDKEPQVKQAAVTTLTQLGPAAKDALPALLEVHKGTTIVSDPQGTLRRSIVVSLGKLESEPAEKVKLYTDVLKVEKDTGIRATAVTALGEVGPDAKGAMQALLDVYKASPAAPKATDPQGARKAVVEALSKIEPEPEKLVPFLVDVVKRDRDLPTRTAAVQALAKLGPMAKAAAPALTDLVKTAKTADDKTLAKDAEAALEKIQAK